MDASIDLGRKSEYPGMLSSPTPMRDEQVYYPEFTYSGDKELNLPKRGKMTIEFCVTREVEESREGGEDYYSCTIKVEKILDVVGEKDERPSKRDMSAEESLDAIAKSLSKLREHEDTEEEKY
jgi:hypothetical protein